MDKEFENKVIAVVQKYQRGRAFTEEKYTDTPTDALSVVSRKYVNLNGTTASRPTSSIVGQQYFDTTIGYPIYANGNNWVNSVASVVG